MLPFDFIEMRAGVQPKFHSGQLFSLPAELVGASKIARYSQLYRQGIHTIDHGYVALVVSSSDGISYCVPGLIPNNSEFRNKLFVNDALRVDRVEKYLHTYIKERRRAQIEMRDKFMLVMHDLRSISTTLSAMAEEARLANEGGSVPQHLLESLASTQYLLKLRQDSLDFDLDHSEESDLIETFIFRKVDRVCRAFMAIASKKKVNIRYAGNSFSTARTPSGFEFVPFVVMDNAVKYSPNNTTINVKFEELDGLIIFSVSSIGPNISESEREAIFERGFRGAAATAGGHRGNGLGLFNCAQLLKKCGGSIFVSVGGEDIPTSKGVCRDITFTVRVPIANKKIRPVDA